MTMSSSPDEPRPAPLEKTDPAFLARQRKARRTVLILALVSAVFYVVFFLEHWFFS